jgi:hypothetical protein
MYTISTNAQRCYHIICQFRAWIEPREGVYWHPRLSETNAKPQNQK